MAEALLLGTIYLGAAVLAVPIAARLGLGSVLGYLLAGIAIGLIPGLGAETRELQHVAEFGVVVLLFLIGLEMEPRALWDMRHKLLGLGGLQIGLTILAVSAALIALGEAWRAALALGFVFSLSSTAIVLQTLTEKGLMRTHGGRSTFAVLLTQDIAVIPMLAALPLLVAAPGFVAAPDGSLVRPEVEDHGAEAAHHGAALIADLPGWGVTLVTLGAVGLVIALGIFGARPAFRHIQQARLREMNTALALLFVVGTAAIMSLVGLSPALGTFLAGVMLANTEFRHELESDLEPFKGLLLGLFFITVGAGIDFDLLTDAPLRILALTAALLLVKGVILFLLGTVFQLRGRDRWLFTLGLAQAGEFGFVLLSFSTQQGVLPQATADEALLVVAMSMLATPLLFILYGWLHRRDEARGHEAEPDQIDETGNVIIAGIGRFGQVVNRLVQGAGFKTTVLDNNLSAIETIRAFGYTAFYGDPTRPDLLHAAGIETARVLVVALDDRDAALRLVRYARRIRPDLHIIARARDRTHVFELNRAGADQIVREVFDSSLRAGRYVLETMGLSDWEASQIEMAFYHADRAAMKDLAELWQPGVPLSKNPAYVERAKEVDRALETALAETLDKRPARRDGPGGRSGG